MSYFKLVAFNYGNIMTFGNIKVRVFNTHDQLCFQAAVEVARKITEKPNLVISLPTGGTPEKMYEYLVEMYKQGQISFRNVRFFQLDEYLGLSKDDPFSYYYYLNEHLFKHVDINPYNIFTYDALNQDPEAESLRYERAIKKVGGIDLVVLGIGNNGHIAFNEPGSSGNSKTRIIKLEESTIRANARFFSDPSQVPRRAITMGIGTILEAQEIMLLASGVTKADAVSRAVLGPVTEDVPASQLQNHKNTTFFIDNDIKQTIF